MDEQRTWTSEEAMSNLESLTKLDWNREKLPNGVRELLESYEAAIPQLAAEIRRLRGKQRERSSEDSDEDPKDEQGQSSGATDGYEDLAEFARRLGLEQK